MLASGRVQGFVGLAHHVRHGVPQRMLDDRKPPLGFIHRRGARAADFFGVPRFGNQSLQALLDVGFFTEGEVAMILRGELRSDRIVFLNQRAARHLSWVRREHQFDVQRADLLRQRFRAVPFGQQAFEQGGQDQGFKGFGLPLFAAMNEFVLFSNIGQVQELVEGAGHRQHFIVAQVPQNRAQLFARGTTAVVLGALTNTFDLGEKRFAVLVTDRIPQQFTQQVNVIAQACINIGHQQFLQRYPGTAPAPRVRRKRHPWQAASRIKIVVG